MFLKAQLLQSSSSSVSVVNINILVFFQHATVILIFMVVDVSSSWSIPHPFSSCCDYYELFLAFIFGNCWEKHGVKSFMGLILCFALEWSDVAHIGFAFLRFLIQQIVVVIIAKFSQSALWSNHKLQEFLSFLGK